MSGKIEFINYVILSVAIIAAMTDLFSGKIYNWLTVPTALGGFLAAGMCFGWTGIGQAFLGFIAGFVLYGWMFGLRFVGAGDVKLLMALGAWGGFRYTR